MSGTAVQTQSTGQVRVGPTPKALDLIEKFAIIAFYAYFLASIARAVWEHGDLTAVMLGVSETMVLMLVLFRKPAGSFSQRLPDWALAVGATLAPTLLRPVANDPTLLRNMCVIVMVGGMCFQIFAKYFLGRRFGIVAANRGICAQGPYRLVRHPIYLGYLINHLAFLCAAFSYWNLFAFALTYSLMIPRIFAEERLLRRDDEYEAYCGEVRSRLIPGVL